MLIKKTLKEVMGMLSLKEQKEVKKAMPNITKSVIKFEAFKKHEEVIKLYEKELTVEQFLPIMMYFSSEEVIKHSKRLTFLTIGLLVATLLLLVAAIIQIVSSSQLLNAVWALSL